MTIHFAVKMASKTALFSHINMYDCHTYDWLVHAYLYTNTPMAIKLLLNFASVRQITGTFKRTIKHIYIYLRLTYCITSNAFRLYY